MERGSAQPPVVAFPGLRRLRLPRSILRILDEKRGRNHSCPSQDAPKATRCLLLNQDRCLLLKQDRCLLLRQSRCLLLRPDRCLLVYCDRALPCLNTIHLSCLNSRHLSCLSSRHLSCLNSRHLSCLSRRQKTSVPSQQPIVCVSETGQGPDTWNRDGSRQPYSNFSNRPHPQDRIAVRF